MAEALILGTMMVGQCTAFAPNYNKAVLAAARVFRYLKSYQTKNFFLFLQIQNFYFQTFGSETSDRRARQFRA